MSFALFISFHVLLVFCTLKCMFVHTLITEGFIFLCMRSLDCPKYFASKRFFNEFYYIYLYDLKPIILRSTKKKRNIFRYLESLRILFPNWYKKRLNKVLLVLEIFCIVTYHHGQTVKIRQKIIKFCGQRRDETDDFVWFIVHLDTEET